MKITVSDSTRQMLAARSPTGELSDAGARRLIGGKWEIEIDEELADSLAMIHQDPDTAIRMACAGTKVGRA